MNLLKKTYLFLIAFFVGYPILYLIQFWHIKNIVDKKDQTKVTTVAQMLEHSSEEKPDGLFLNMFDVYRQTEGISYYVLRNQTGQLVYPSSEHAIVKESEFKKDSASEFKRKIRIQDQNYVIFFGKDEVGFGELLVQLLKDQKEVLAVFFLGIILLIHQVAAYFLHFDVKNIIQWFKGRNDNGSAEILSSEAVRLKDYIQSVETQRESAEIQVNEYKANSYSGLTWAHEQMKAGITSAEIVAARCDINNYTVLKQKVSAELLQYVVQTFFNRGGEYLLRYGAYKENAAGDEITFFIPKNENPDAELLSLHVIRGFFEVFQDLSKEVSLPDFKLTAKAAIDAGLVELGKLGGNSETEGQALINTARFLTAINEKDFSTLAVQSLNFSKFESHAVSHREQSVMVKNYSDPFVLTYIQDISGYPQKSLNLSELKYYRTDRDISFILDSMAVALKDSNVHLFHTLRNHISSISVSRLNYHATENYKKLLSLGLSLEKPQMLSGIALLAKSLFTNESVNDFVISDLVKCLEHSNKRVVSNAREALQTLRPELIDLNKFVENKDNRIAADALIDLIKIEGLTDDNATRILNWLTSNSSAFQLSAVYVAYQIKSYWTEKRSEYVSLNQNFKRLDSAIRKLDHTNPSLLKWLSLYDGIQSQRKAG